MALRTAVAGRARALVAAILVAAASTGAARAAAPAGQEWTASWGSSQQAPEPQNAMPADAVRAGTLLRQVVHLSAGGTRLRLRLSNAFGTQPLAIAAVHVARSADAASPRTVPGSDRTASFAGAASVIIPAGADYLSDPLPMAAGAGADLAITIRYAAAATGQTGHPGSRATSYLLAEGGDPSAADLPDAQRIDHWYQLAGVEVAGAGAGTIVALGDSITDGHGATTNGNDRWPDQLAARLRADPATRHMGVVNQGIGGNRLLLDGLGPNALARFDRDVLAPAGMRFVIVLEGVNDLGTLTRDAPVSPAEHRALVARITAAYAQIIVRAHARGVKAVGATILPYTGSDYYHPDAANEADRQAVNAWIRAPGHFDGVIDFDQVTRDPEHPERLLPAYDSGDHLHPSPAGYRAMADAIPLSLFR